MHLSFTKKNKSDKKGFTLVELVVSLGIFAFIAAAIFVRNSEFNSSIILTNLAYDVALTVRQAQVYGISVRPEEAGTNEFNIGYGVDISESRPTSYYFFADRNNNGWYGSGEMIDAYTIKRGNRIGDFCATTLAGAEHCNSDGYINILDITFKRPEADAIIKTDRDTDSYKSARIILQSPNGSKREVRVESTGQISIVYE